MKINILKFLTTFMVYREAVLIVLVNITHITVYWSCLCWGSSERLLNLASRHRICFFQDFSCKYIVKTLGNLTRLFLFFFLRKRWKNTNKSKGFLSGQGGSPGTLYMFFGNIDFLEKRIINMLDLNYSHINYHITYTERKKNHLLYDIPFWAICFHIYVLLLLCAQICVQTQPWKALKWVAFDRFLFVFMAQDQS